MNQTAISPVHHLLDAESTQWGEVAGRPIAIRIGTAEVDREAVRKLGLCDVSVLPKLGLKGPGAASWLAAQGIDVPGDTFASQPLADGGVIINQGGGEYMLESGPAASVVPSIQHAADTAIDARSEAGDSADLGGQFYRVERQDAGFILGGVDAGKVLAQTCGVNFAQAEAGRLIFSRVAGVSAAILPQTADEISSYRLWADASYAVYLWQTLGRISGELGGRVVGAACLFSID